MDQQKTKSAVLARIPAVGPAENKHVDDGLPPSRGRLMSQSLSFRLLAAVAVLLMAVATLQFTLSRSGQPADPSTTADPLSEWRPGPLTPSADAAPAWIAPVAETSTPIPASPSATPDVPPQPEVENEPMMTASTETPLMSPWPNPAHPISPQTEAAADESHTGVNQAMAIRPSDQIRNRHDRTRSSIH